MPPLEKKLTLVIFIFLFIILSSILVKQNKFVAYIIVFILWLFFLLLSYKKIKPRIWVVKLILLYLAFAFVIYSMWNRNKIIDNYVITILFLLNILIIIPICLFRDKDKFWKDILKTLVIMYLLFTFKFDNFKMKKGKFVNVDKQWLIIHLFVLLFIYQDNNCWGQYKLFNIKPIIWVSLYPLLFPLDEYLIHRSLSLSIGSIIYWHYKYLNKKN